MTKNAWSPSSYVTRRRVVGALGGAAILLGEAARKPALADTWPSRPVTIIVPFPPGGNTDTMARVLAAKLGETFGKAFVVDNRGGASGSIGTAAVAHAEPDGYTILFGAVQQVSVIPYTEHVTYDPKRDLSFISIFGEGPFTLGAAAEMNVSTLKEFIDYVNARPGKLTYASGGVGSLSHLVAALFMKRAGLQMTHVPYRGGGPAVADLVGGHVQAYFGNASELLPFAKDPKVKLLATSAPARLPAAPDLATVSETFPGFSMTSWNGLIGPAALPRDIIERVAKATADIARDPSVKETLTRLGITPVGDTPDEFVARVKSEAGRLNEAIAAAGLGNGAP
jgi:tripartite-type tricarboxylate transporter receptor subunit TctC